MNLSEYAKMDATELAAHIRTGEVTTAEVNETAQKALTQVDERLHIVSQLLDPIAGDANGPLAGVPLVAKDLVMNIAGVANQAGSRLLADKQFVPEASSELFLRLQKAGLTTHAVVPSPEFGFNTTCEALLYGEPSRNPWDVSKSTGGSSGASSAAVASGAVPVAHATDGGGSIRIPAASCGIVGLKPTRGRTPFGPEYGLPLMGLAVGFVVTRTVRDTALLLDQTEGPEVGAFFDIPRPATAYADVIREKTGQKRIAYMTQLKGTPGPDAATIAALEKTAETLRSLGHIVEEASPDYDYDQWRRGNYVAWMGFLASGAYGLAKALEVEPSRDNLEAATLTCAEAGAKLSAMDAEEAWMMINATCRSFGSFMTDYDAMLLPTLRGPALPLGVMNQNDPDITAEGWHDKVFKYFPYCAAFNVTGQPAISIPNGMSDGLPLAAQLVGKLGEDATLLQLASDLEEAAPWAGKTPSVFVG